MQLKEFLQTASEDAATALQEAHAFTKTVPVFITSNTLTVYVVSAGLYDVFTDIANDASSPVRGICMALMDRLKGQSEFNLSQSLPLGQANIAMLDTLIVALPAHADKITGLKTTLLAISNQTVHLFANVNLYDVMIARNQCQTTSVTVVSGYIVFTLGSDAPPHQLRVLATNPRTNKQTVLGRVTVSDSGLYEFKLPTHYLQFTDFVIDDAYGAIQ